MTKLSSKERNRYLLIAKQLCYSKETLERIQKASTEEECERALIDARHSM